MEIKLRILYYQAESFKFRIHLNYTKQFMSNRTPSYSMEDKKSIPLNEIKPCFLIIIQNT